MSGVVIVALEIIPGGVEGIAEQAHEGLRVAILVVLIVIIVAVLIFSVDVRVLLSKSVDDHLFPLQSCIHIGL